MLPRFTDNAELLLCIGAVVIFANMAFITYKYVRCIETDILINRKIELSAQVFADTNTELRRTLHLFANSIDFNNNRTQSRYTEYISAVSDIIKETALPFTVRYNLLQEYKKEADALMRKFGISDANIEIIKEYSRRR